VLILILFNQAHLHIFKGDNLTFSLVHKQVIHFINFHVHWVFNTDVTTLLFRYTAHFLNESKRGKTMQSNHSVTKTLAQEQSRRKIELLFNSSNDLLTNITQLYDNEVIRLFEALLTYRLNLAPYSTMNQEYLQVDAVIDTMYTLAIDLASTNVKNIKSKEFLSQLFLETYNNHSQLRQIKPIIDFSLSVSSNNSNKYVTFQGSNQSNDVESNKASVTDNANLANHKRLNHLVKNRLIKPRQGIRRPTRKALAQRKFERLNMTSNAQELRNDASNQLNTGFFSKAASSIVDDSLKNVSTNMTNSG
jgi:hypothetical protein